MCYIPLNMAIIIFLCLLGSFPSTATEIYASFILHTICHHLKRMGQDVQLINEFQHLPQSVKLALQQLEKIAFDGLVEDKIVFTIEDLPDMCREDPTCYGLLQSVECYCSFEIGSPTKSFNFLHLGIQEYLAARYVTTLRNDEIYQLLQDSFLVQVVVKSKAIRLANMWILYCGITKGMCSSLRSYLGIHLSGSQETPMIFERDPKNVFYLFQCFQEAHDDQISDILIHERFRQSLASSDQLVIWLNDLNLLPPHLVSLGFFLSMSYKWTGLILPGSHIGDHGISILHQYLCKEKVDKQEIQRIDFSNSDLTAASSSAIGDIITHLQPQALWLSQNSIVDLWDISTAVVNSTPAVKEIDLAQNNLTSEVASEISNMMKCLMELDISHNKLDEHAAVILSKSLKETKTLVKLNINNNEIKAAGATEFADGLIDNTSLLELRIDDNDIGPCGAAAIARAIASNQTLLKLYISHNKLGSDGADALSKAIATTNTLELLDISGNGIKLTGIKAISKLIAENTSLKILHINNTPIYQNGALAIAKAITKNKTLHTLAMGGTDTMDEESVIKILESLYNNTSIKWLGLLMPIPSHVQGSRMETELCRIEKKIKKIETEIVEIRRTCNKEMLELYLMGTRTF